jgi:hypothetical protein
VLCAFFRAPLTCDRFIYIEVLDGAIQKKAKKRSSTTDTKTSWKTVEKPVENRLRNH